MDVSIIIATHARPASLCRLLLSLQPQLIAGRHELFVAENGTPAPLTADIILARSPAETAGVKITHLHDCRPGKCRIQNRALAQAQDC